MNKFFYNGDFFKETDACINIKNRALNYGDGFFETIKIIDSIPFNFNSHLKRIKYAYGVLKIKRSFNLELLEKRIISVIKKNEIINGTVKLQVFRKGSGKYMPDSNDSEIIISAKSGFPFVKNLPVSLCFYDEQLKSSSSLSNIKSSNSLIYVLASLYAKEFNFDSSILFNTKGFALETSNSNIFVVRNNKIFTPKLDDGCVAGTMRDFVLKKINVFECSLTKSEIINADELFITNANLGVVPVKKIEENSYNSYNLAFSLQEELI